MTYGTVELDFGELRGRHVGQEAADELKRHVADVRESCGDQEDVSGTA